MKLLYRLAPVLLAASLLASCKKDDVATYYNLQAEPGFFNIGVLGTTFSTTGFAAKYGPGKTIPITAVYNQPDNPTAITVFQATKTDSMQVGSYPAAGTFNQTFKTTAQPIAYTVPTTYALNTAVRLDVTMTFANGAQRRRRINYIIAN
ncbi:MAG TPA: hypothetical protein VFO93_15105 [Hymenobacter sp.]|uniref:hypothetical protein n=1 Tax=Hymenobacter sp. TaxID=1898978 RepID=UPI002D7FC076|nr:hypothetical protein [Hymenobacter sp.]HET9504870.1 hypothetical protein [Hymenobacter sp.]